MAVVEMDVNGGGGEQSTNNNNRAPPLRPTAGSGKLYLLGILVLVACIVIIVVPSVVVVVTQNNNHENHSGEHQSRIRPTDGTIESELSSPPSKFSASSSSERVLLRSASTTDHVSSTPTAAAADDALLLPLLLDTAAEMLDEAATLAPSVVVLPGYNESERFDTDILTFPPTESPTTITDSSPTTITLAAAAPDAGPQIATTVNSFVVVRTIPHDPNAFTQGLTFDPENGSIVYESTGLVGRSSIRKVDMETGEVLLQHSDPPDVFGEGLAYYTTTTTTTGVSNSNKQGRLIHITWTSQRGFILDAETFDVLQEFQFLTTNNEGWGITYVPHLDQFIVSDGSNNLHFWDSSNYQEVQRVAVTLQSSSDTSPEPVYNLNELEWDNATQTVLANVWQQDIVVRINPFTGAVITEYDLSELYTDRLFSSDVLNGIAISPDNELWVTGKLWPQMYSIKFNE